MSDLLDRFQKVDVSAFPDVHLLSEDLDVALWVLDVADHALGLNSLSAAEIAHAATSGLRLAVSRQSVAQALRDARELVAVVPRIKPTKYMLMKAGRERIRGHQMKVVIVDPESAFTSLQSLDGIIASFEANVAICDPYVDDKTLLTLVSIPREIPTRLMTFNISDAVQFRRKYQAFQKEFGNVEIRVSATPDLHDRYMIDGNRMWLLGQSLNGIGKKQTFIVALGQDIRATVLQSFDRRWNSATAFK